MRRRPLMMLAAALAAVSFIPATSAEALTTSTSSVWTSGSSSPATRTATVMTSKGNPVIATWNEDRENIDIVVCSNPTCTRHVLRSNVSASPNGEFDMAIGGDGLPVLAVADNDSWPSHIAVIKCLDAGCSQRTREPVAFNSGAWLGNVAIAVGEKSHPVVTYTTTTQSQVLLGAVSCNNTDCAGFWTYRSLTHSTLYVSDDGNIEHDVTIGSDHYARIVWSVDGGPGWLATCRSLNCAQRSTAGFSERNPVTNPSIASDGTDFSIVWVGKNGAIQKKDCWFRGCSSVHNVTEGNATGFVPNVVSLGGGREVVAFLDGKSRLMLADCDTTCDRPDLIAGNGDKANAMLGMAEYKGAAVVSHRFPRWNAIAVTWAG